MRPGIFRFPTAEVFHQDVLNVQEQSTLRSEKKAVSFSGTHSYQWTFRKFSSNRGFQISKLASKTRTQGATC